MKRFITPVLLAVFLLLSFSTNSSIAKEPFRKMAIEAKGAENNKAAEINNDGVRHFTMGKHWTEAGEFFKDALKIDPSLAEAHFNLGLVRHKKNKHEVAAYHFKKAAELAPDDPRIQNSEMLKKHKDMKIPDELPHDDAGSHTSGESKEHKH